MSETPAALERRITERLHPLDAADTGPGGSDFDLNPGLRTAGASLSEAAVLVPIILRPDGPSVLFTRRADTLARHSGQVSFPGGRCDPGETAVEAALREAEEEVGLDRAFVRPLALADPYETVTGFRIAPVVAFVTEGFTLTASPAEVAEVFEAPWAWLMAAENNVLHVRDADDANPRRSWWSLRWEGRDIWGATAGMLAGLRRRLYEDRALRRVAARPRPPPTDAPPPAR